MAKTSKAGKLLRYDVLNLPPTQTVLDRWPELRRQPEFIRHALTGQGDLILRLVILLTDVGSPYPRRYPDLPERKVMAMRRVGLKPNAQLGRVLMAWQHDGAREMAVRYLRMQHNMELAAALASEEAVWQNIAKVQAPIETEFDDEDYSPPSDDEPETEGGSKFPRKQRKSFSTQEEKEAARQRAYKIRNDLEAALPAQVERVKRQMAAIFRGDDQLQAAVAAAYEEALKDDGDSVEAEYLGDDAEEEEDDEADDLDNTGEDDEDD